MSRTRPGTEVMIAIGAYAFPQESFGGIISETAPAALDFLGVKQALHADSLIAAASRATGIGALAETSLLAKRSFGGIQTVPVTGNTTGASVFYVFKVSPSISGDATALATSAREAIVSLLQVTSNIYRDVIQKCRSIMDDLGDGSEPEEREAALERLKDILEPFNSAIAPVFFGLIRSQRTYPIGVSFLLAELLPRMTDVAKEARLSIIETALSEAQPSTRFAAIQALDNMDIAESKQLMAAVYPSEQNKLIRNFIDASLRVD